MKSSKVSKDIVCNAMNDAHILVWIKGDRYILSHTRSAETRLLDIWSLKIYDAKPDKRADFRTEMN